MRHAFGPLLVCGALGACSNPPTQDTTPPTPSSSSNEGASQAAAGGGGTGSKSGAGSSQASGVGQAAGSPASSGAGAAGRPAAMSGNTAGTAGAGKAAAGSGAAGAGAAGAGAAVGGTAGTTSSTGTAGTVGGQASSGEGAGVKPPCLEKNSQVIAIGDSYLNWITHNFPEDFRTEFGEYRMYAVGGASMASGGIAGFIPDQLTQAVQEDPDIIAGVMTGGGNDILIADTTMYPDSDTCKDRTDAPMVQVCKDVIDGAMQTAKKLMQSAANAGLKDVVYLFYPHIPGGGFGGMNPNAILEYSLPLARDLCEQAQANTDGKLRCHFLDLTPVFKDHPMDWFADDGIHENEKGSLQMAKEVVKIFKDKCIAQPEASGCCTP